MFSPLIMIAANYGVGIACILMLTLLACGYFVNPIVQQIMTCCHKTDFTLHLLSIIMAIDIVQSFYALQILKGN
jgi:hypothetical protein